MKAWQHFRTITRHRHLVMRYCFRLGLYRQGLCHDLSKYSPTEFLPGAKYYLGHRSPNDAERLDKGYSSAWLHHKGRNRHHLEYWVDYDLTRKEKLAGIKMPVKYVAEMFCDRVAASQIYLKEQYTDAAPYEYYLRSRPYYLIHPETDALLHTLLLYLKDHGLEEALSYIRTQVLNTP